MKPADDGLLRGEAIALWILATLVILAAAWRYGVSSGRLRPEVTLNGKALETYEYRIDLNRASARELALLPGIGDRRAHAIVSYRATAGGFEEIDDLAEVDGITDAGLQRLRDLVTVEGNDDGGSTGE